MQRAAGSARRQLVLLGRKAAAADLEFGEAGGAQLTIQRSYGVGFAELSAGPRLTRSSCTAVEAGLGRSGRIERYAFLVGDLAERDRVAGVRLGQPIVVFSGAGVGDVHHGVSRQRPSNQ